MYGAYPRLAESLTMDGCPMCEWEKGSQWRGVCIVITGWAMGHPPTETCVRATSRLGINGTTVGSEYAVATTTIYD